MESPELALLKKIKLQTGRKLNTLLVGEYHSAFKGMGLSFESVREYLYGDDIRSIDWNVSARMNHLFVKEYVEERELSVVLMIDMSGSTEFGSGRSKKDLALEVAAVFLYLSQMNNDRLSVLLFTDRVEKFIRPRKGRKYILKVLDEILTCEPVSRGTDISVAVDFLQRVLKKRSVIVMISDFLDANRGFLLKMKLLGRKHDIIPVVVSDPFESGTGIPCFAEFVDLETGKVFYSDALPDRGACAALPDFDVVYLSTAGPIEVPILRYFEKRNRRRARAG